MEGKLIFEVQFRTIEKYLSNCKQFKEFLDLNLIFSSRGPLSAHFSETLAGLPTIRASRQQNRFIKQMFHHLDINTNAFLLLNTSSRWLSIALVIVFKATSCLIYTL